MTLQELLSKNPKLDLSTGTTTVVSGSTISPQDALDGLLGYEKFNTHKNIDQTFVVRFDTQKLMTWLSSVQANTDEVNMLFSAVPKDPNKPDEIVNLRYTIIIWPYKNSKPSTQDGKETSEVLEPYNIGNRHPIV